MVGGVCVFACPMWWGRGGVRSESSLLPSCLKSSYLFVIVPPVVPVIVSGV